MPPLICSPPPRLSSSAHRACSLAVTGSRPPTARPCPCAKGDVLQAAALETVGATFDGEDGGVGIGEDDQPFLALAIDQIVDGRHRRIDQQPIARQQPVETGARECRA